MRQSVSFSCTVVSVALGVLLILTGSDARAQDATVRVAAVRSAAVTVSGFVRDADRGVRLPGANVYAPALDLGVAANAAGFYTLRLPSSADTLYLRVSFVGYRTERLALVPDRDRQLDVALAPEAAEAGAVEVVAERADDAVASTRMSTTAITAAEVERLPSFLGEPDPIKTIQLLPGVQSGAEGQTGLYVRGGGPDQNLVLLDGAPVYNVSHVLGFLSVFNAAAVDRVELTTGGFPARYGGRLSSVVDVALREGNRERYGTEGSVGLVASSLTAEGPLPGLPGSFVVSGRRTYIDVLARPFLAGRTNGQDLTSYFYDLNARLTLDPSPRDRLSLSAYLGDDTYGTAYTSTASDGFREQFEGGATWGNALATLRWSRPLTPRLFATAALTASRYRFVTTTRLAQTDPGRGTDTFQEVAYASGITDLGGRLDLEWTPTTDHAVRLGGGLTRHAFNPGVGTLGYRFADSTATALADSLAQSVLTPDVFAYRTWEGFVFAEDDLRLTDRLQANVGLHAAAMRVGARTYASLQPRLALRLLLTPDWSLKGSFSQMDQYVHLLAGSGINLPTDLWLAPTERIGPQRSWQAALGSEARIGRGWTLRLEGFYKDMRGLVEYKPGASFVAPGARWEDKVEVGRGWAYGGEVFLRRSAGRTTGWLGYTLSFSQRRFDDLNDGAAFPYRYDRRHDVALVLSHRFSDALDIGATWVYGTGQAVTLATARFFENGLLDPRQLQQLDPNNPGGAVPLPTLVHYGSRGGYRMAAYHRLDVALNWHFGGALFLKGGESTLSVGAYNAYNRRNPFFLFAAPGEGEGRVYKQASLFPVLPAIAYRFRF